MALLKIKFGDELYEVSRLPLGEAQRLKHEHGVDDLTHIDLTDPDVLVGVLEVAVRAKHPDWTPAQIKEHVEGIDFLTAEDVKEEEPDPQSAGTVAEAAEPASSGTSETTPETSGPQPSEQPTA